MKSGGLYIDGFCLVEDAGCLYKQQAAAELAVEASHKNLGRFPCGNVQCLFNV